MRSKPKRVVEFDGMRSKVRSDKIEIPNLQAMNRFEALQWLIRHTYPTGYSKGNPLGISWRDKHWGEVMGKFPTHGENNDFLEGGSGHPESYTGRHPSRCGAQATVKARGYGERGSCDVCDAQNVRISRCDAAGIETYACTKCRGDEPRRCETNECDLDGSCIACLAVSGEVCQDE